MKSRFNLYLPLHQFLKRRFFLSAISLLFITALAFPAERVGLIKINGAIGPITASYIKRALDKSAQEHYACLIIELDTPGGLLSSTKEIVELLLEPKVPTVVYITPAGATAASAGCFITLAADIAAMAPATSIGAAHPVEMGGGGAGSGDSVMKNKLENYASTFIESIASKRNRNVEWAKASVRQSAAITAEKALELKVIDVIAPSADSLLKQVDGRAIRGRVLHTAGAQINEIPMLMREKVFQRLWGPEVMYVLMLIAIYGIIGELSNPGSVLPAVAGVIALVLALFMSSILPVNITGVVLIVLAIALFIVDIFAPTHGVLTGGGIIAFIIGSIMLFDTGNSAFRLSLALIIPASVITAGFFSFIVGAGLRAQLAPKKTGAEAMKGKTAVAESAVDAKGGKVFFEGEYWNAVSETPVDKGETVEVIGVQGLTLKIKPKPNKQGV
ncbi:MAG TPA: nodulation protein NfeD [Chitinivibrionales bacterium]|nr:nodulation protein NfeD [Chitinivibrionales bacterium]